MTVNLFFILIGVIVFIGFGGMLLFQRFRIPDLLILIGIGLVLGPISGLMKEEIVFPIAPYFGALALMMILFEGGIDLSLDRVIGQFKTAIILVLISFTTSMLAIALVAHLFFGLEWIRSLLLGSILGCTSGTILIPIVSRMNISDESKAIINMESTLSDALAVIVTIILIQILTTQEAGVSSVLGSLFSAFTNAFFVTLIFGLLWMRVLAYIKGKPLSYMLTFAAILLLYAFVETIHGSGAMAVLLFGVVLANGDKIVSVFSRKARARGVLQEADFDLDETIKWFHSEFSFLVRTFFFVYIGLIFSFRNLTWEFLQLPLAIFVAILLFRYIAVYAAELLFAGEHYKGGKVVLLAMVSRGLTSAVLATLPGAAGIYGTETFLEITFVIIVLTNVILTISVFLLEKQFAGAELKGKGKEKMAAK